MSPEISENIMTHHLEENRRLQQQFFPHVDFETVFGPRQLDEPIDDERHLRFRQRKGQIQKRAIRGLIESLQMEEPGPQMTA